MSSKKSKNTAKDLDRKLKKCEKTALDAEKMIVDILNQELSLLKRSGSKQELQHEYENQLECIENFKT